MTATTDTAAHGEDLQQPESPGDFRLPAQPAAVRAVIAIELLTAHPGNVRRDIHLDQEFLDSIAELGILTPLRITPDGSGCYRVIAGHRRLAAAEKLGLTELPLALLAVIATAYEDRMDGDAGRATWRTDQRYTQCNRKEASTYLRFLASAGYELSAIEQAAADGVPYTGDQPEDHLTSADEQDTCAGLAETSENAQAGAEDTPAEGDAADSEVPTGAL
jgi:hypothetical protein